MADLDILERILTDIHKAREVAATGYGPWPYVMKLSEADAEAARDALIERCLFIDEPTEKPYLFAGEKWIGTVDGVHLVEVING